MRKAAEKHLAQMEGRYRALLEAAPDAMLVVNQGGEIVLLNLQAEKEFGYRRDELLGQKVKNIIPEGFAERLVADGLRTAEDALTQQIGAGIELSGRRKDGSEFPIEIMLSPLESAAGTLVTAAIRNISVRKAAEKHLARIEGAARKAAQAALGEKDILLSEIHHRVKNNLQVVSALLDLQSSRIEDKAAVRLLIDSQNRIRSMALIHEKLYESNDFAQVDFRSFLDTLVPILVASYSIDPGQTNFSIDAAGISLPIKAAIPCGLIVNELVSNALKHAFPGGKRGDIKIDLATEPNGHVFLSVSDNGCGIPDELGLGNTTTLGLQLVTLLTDQLGAELAIQRSNPTRFTLRFKVEP